MSGIRFPQDLVQADGAHCSVDALLLAAFVDGSCTRALDLGAGCGVIGLGLLLRNAAGSVEALEKDAEQCAAARTNARALGLEPRFAVRCADLEAPATAAEIWADADLVVCNPPWRLLTAQRAPASERRRAALYGTAETLPLFARAAAARLRRGGQYAAVVGAERLPDLLHALRAASLCPVRLRLVHPRPERPAVFALLAARYQVQGRLCIEPPLVLHGEGAGYSEAARQFCAWLHAPSDRLSSCEATDVE